MWLELRDTSFLVDGLEKSVRNERVEVELSPVRLSGCNVVLHPSYQLFAAAAAWREWMASSRLPACLALTIFLSSALIQRPAQQAKVGAGPGGGSPSRGGEYERDETAYSIRTPTKYSPCSPPPPHLSPHPLSPAVRNLPRPPLRPPTISPQPYASPHLPP